MTPAVAIVAALSAAGIAAYLVSAYRHDRRVAARFAHPTATADVVAEAEAITRHAAYTTDESTWP